MFGPVGVSGFLVFRAHRQRANQGDFRRRRDRFNKGLEERGALPRNRARTPRESLRLFALPRVGPAPAAAAPLGVLTNGLERFWYAGYAASADDFSACVGASEALGCRLD